jgi:branched-chain amino acid transport system substrate-binding protein
MNQQEKEEGKMRLDKRVWLFVLGFGLVVSPAFAQNPINVGFTMDFSGVTAQVGNREAPVVEMVVKEVNDAGGINGRQIKLHTLDNGADPSRVVGNLKMLRDLNKCSAMFEGVNSSCGIAAKKWADQNKVPVITEGAMTDAVLQKEGKAWFFKSCASVSTHAESTLARLKKLGYTKVAFQGSTLAWGVDVRDTVKKLAPKYGIEIVGEVLCEPKSKDLTIQATRLRDTGAKAVICADYEAETGVWAKAVKTIGWNPFLFQYSSGLLSSAMKIYPPGTFEGWETSMTIDVTKPLVKEVWDKAAAFSGKRWEDDMITRTWDGIRLLIEAIRLSGNPDSPEAVRDGFYKIKNLPIVSGRKDSTGSFEIGRNEVLKPQDILIYVVKDGKIVPVK